MKLNELKPAPGSRKGSKRLGRGASSGQGKTAGRGHKGQKSRSGGSIPPGFEGGQMPLKRRLPKRGFRNFRAERYVEIRLDALNRFSDGAEITEEILRDAGLMKDRDSYAKVIKSGSLERQVVLRTQKVSAGARQAIEAVGGRVEEP